MPQFESENVGEKGSESGVPGEQSYGNKGAVTDF